MNETPPTKEKPLKKGKALNKDPSMRNAFIRVTKENMTGVNKDIPYTYTETMIKDILDEWAWDSGILYWFIEHTLDNDLNGVALNAHFHIVIKFKTSSHFSTIKAKFPYGDIEAAKSLKSTIQYLVHLNSPNKTPYSWDQVITNCSDLSPYKRLSKSQQDIQLSNIIEQIQKGDITQSNFQKCIPDDVYCFHKTIIDNAFELKTHKIITENISRPIHVIYLFGPSGIGKTAFAKMLCKQFYPDEEPCPGSSACDPLQDYKGQKVLLLDDAGDSSFKYKDLLKLLDPFTRSSTKSRYHNKHFTGDLIIFTSTEPVENMYRGVDSPNNKYELMRRIPEVYEFRGDHINILLFQPNDKRIVSYSHVHTIPNPFYGWNTQAPSKPSYVFQKLPEIGISLDAPAKEPPRELAQNTHESFSHQYSAQGPIINSHPSYEIIQYNGKHHQKVKSISQTKIEEPQTLA